MNHLTLYAYEEDGELIVYRCEFCGTTGPKGSKCEHDTPIYDGYKGAEFVERMPVRVPGVGEEPRYTPESDHCIQQPAGVGAEDGTREGRSETSDHPHLVSADSGGNQQPQGGGGS